MKKNFKFYSLGWILLLGLFNLIAFITPALPDTEKYTASFWIGYSFITAAFIGQFVCTWFVLKENCAKKTFYNISLLTTSYAGMISTFVVGLICMVIPPIPYWLAAILCSVILVINIYVFAKAKIAVDYISHIERWLNCNFVNFNKNKKNRCIIWWFFAMTHLFLIFIFIN